MTKHSKNNTASSIFSYAEYKKLDYGTKRVCRGLYRTASSANFSTSKGSEMSQCDNTMHVLSVYRRLETRLHAMVGICSAKSVYTLTFVSGWVLLESHGVIYFKGALSQTEERYQETES